MNGLLRENVEKLRAVSNCLESEEEAKTFLFPGWDRVWDDEQTALVREAAKAILAEGVSRDSGTRVSRKSVVALIHYVADMMEED